MIFALEGLRERERKSATILLLKMDREGCMCLDSRGYPFAYSIIQQRVWLQKMALSETLKAAFTHAI